MAKKELHVKWFPEAMALMGMPDLRLGKEVKLEGVGLAFEGAYYVASTTHAISDGGYVTRFDIERAAIDHVAEKSTGHRRLSLELMVGVIKEIDLKANEIDVSFPWTKNRKKSLCIRVPQPGAFSKHSLWFMPEGGEQVLIAFQPGDSRNPCLLGQIWHGEEDPPASKPETDQPATKL